MPCFAIGDAKAVLWGFLGFDNWTQPCLDWRKRLKKIQYNLIITLSLGSIDADRVISETVL